jgi:hypothetical protein
MLHLVEQYTAETTTKDDEGVVAIEYVIMAGLVAIGVALVVTVTAVVLACLALARRQGPRITLVVLAILFALILAVTAVAMIVDGVQPATSAGEVVGGGVVLVLAALPALCALLLLLPTAGRWYAGRVRR